MITLFYATQTGNARDCAERLGRQLDSHHFPNRLIDLANYSADQLREETLALFVVSTYGEGEPPDDAVTFHASLAKMPAGSLAQLRYSVFALGDIDYVLFCGFGHDCDEFLSRAGAVRLLEVEECNLDQDKRLSGWLNRLLPLLYAARSLESAG